MKPRKNWNDKIFIFLLLTVSYLLIASPSSAQTVTELRTEIDRYEQEITRLKEEQEDRVKEGAERERPCRIR